MKRIISLVLVLVMIAATFALVSCAKDKEKDPIEDGPGTEKDTYMIGEYNFEGKTITIPIFGNEDTWYIDVEEKVGETVEDAVYERDKLAESILNIDIQGVYMPEFDQFKSEIRKVLMAGDSDFDVIMGQQANQIDLCLEGYMLDLNNLAEYGAGGILNFEGDHWNDTYMKYYEYGNARYWLSGGFFIPLLSFVYCTYVNKTLYDKNFLETYGDIYDLAYEGKWTIDKMAEMSSTIYSDVNTNDKLDAGDIVGWNYASASSCLMMGFLMGVGLEASSVNADGSINFQVTSSHKANIDRIQKLFSTFTGTRGMSFNKNATPSGISEFIAGNQLFFGGLFEHLNSFREMQDDFYIIPMPKYNEAQASYRSAIDDNNMIIGIPNCCEDVVASAAAIELLAYLSERDVNDLYYEEALKYKFTRDDKAADMIDFINDQWCTDFVFIWERYIFGEHWLRYNIVNNPVSQINKKQENWVKTFDETIAKLDSVGK